MALTTAPRSAWRMNPEAEAQFGYAKAVKVGDMLFISGSVSMDERGNVIAAGEIAAQLSNALELTNADRLLAQCLEFVRKYPRANPGADLFDWRNRFQTTEVRHGPC